MDIGFTISYANHSVIPFCDARGTTIRFDTVLDGLKLSSGTWKNKLGLFFKVRDFEVACQQAERNGFQFTEKMQRWRSITHLWESEPTPGAGDEWWCGGKRGSQACRRELQELLVRIAS